jgi:ribosomal-protein-alanine N-acetyltransferase
MHDPTVGAGVWDPFPQLETSRLTLRRVTRDDAPRLFQILGDEETMRYWSARAYTSVAQAFQLIDGMSAATSRGEAIHWGIADRSDRALVGVCGYNAWHRTHRRGDISYIVARDQWGKGVMREALHAMLDYGFREMKLHSVEAGVTPGNDGSVRLLERMGFRLEGHTRESFWAEDRFVDSLIFSLLGRDWEAGGPKVVSG